MDLRRTETELDWRENRHHYMTSFERRWWNRINSERQANRVAYAAAVVVACSVGIAATVAAVLLW